MKERIIVAVIFVPLLFIVLFYLPPLALTAVVALICAVASYELIHATGVNNKNERIYLYPVILAISIPVGAYFNKSALVFLFVLIFLMLLMFMEAFAVFRTKRQITLAQILIVVFCGAVMPYFLTSLISLKTMNQGHILVLLPFIAAFATDGGAYFVGIFFGKRKAFPLVSPKKTVEGCIGGIAIGTAVMLIYGVVLTFTTWHEIQFWALLFYGIIGGAVTEIGDLAFSLIKREYDIKDYGKLLPGHGGILDRFDSMVFTAPAMYLLVSAMPAIIFK